MRRSSSLASAASVASSTSIAEERSPASEAARLQLRLLRAELAQLFAQLLRALAPRVRARVEARLEARGELARTRPGRPSAARRARPDAHRVAGACVVARSAAASSSAISASSERRRASSSSRTASAASPAYQSSPRAGSNAKPSRVTESSVDRSSSSFSTIGASGRRTADHHAEVSEPGRARLLEKVERRLRVVRNERGGAPAECSGGCALVALIDVERARGRASCPRSASARAAGGSPSSSASARSSAPSRSRPRRASSSSRSRSADRTGGGSARSRAGAGSRALSRRCSSRSAALFSR